MLGLDTMPVDRFAKEFRDTDKGRWTEQERLGGFCFLLKREVISVVELMEDGPDAGIIDGNRLSLCVRRLGYRLACCGDLFVHHFGSWQLGS